MLAEAQQFFAFLRETDVLVGELRKTWKEFINVLLKHVLALFASVSIVFTRLYT